MTSHTEKYIIAIPNIWRSKDSEAIKFGYLIVYNIRNIFFWNSYTKCDGETNPRPFSKKSKLIVSLDQQCEML